MTTRTRRDLCPGLLRPWIAEDGALVRVRLPGGTLPIDALVALADVAEQHGDGAIRLTSRANLQLRGLHHDGGVLPETVVDAVMATGLIPSPSHERVRNIMVSPLTGRVGGRADLRPVVRRLDELVCAEAGLAELPGRFLFVLDDGRGDVAGRNLDLGLVAVDAGRARIRAGRSAWGEVVTLDRAAQALTTLAARFLEAAGAQPGSPWHVDELPAGGEALLGERVEALPGTRVATGPPALGRITQDDGRHALHLAVPGSGLDRRLVDEIVAWDTPHVIVTPWRTLIVPDLENA
ncbi:sulfite reductase subunit beta [Micromonospora sp. HUAS YX12]|uniref:Sulfite reductase subunit beta n=1 Tax=Micromonospora sp. HUAS YX12 TaxID=3156396 RepID=A0AAU7QVJ2_9ACTN